MEKDLAAAIESALNFGENGHSLYSHISYCNQSNAGQQGSDQYTQGGQAKAAVYHMVKQLTDYDLRTLKIKTADSILLTAVICGRFFQTGKRDG